MKTHPKFRWLPFCLFLLFPVLSAFRGGVSNTLPIEKAIAGFDNPWEVFKPRLFSYPDSLIHGLRRFGMKAGTCDLLGINNNGVISSTWDGLVESTLDLIAILPSEFQLDFDVLDYAQYPNLAIIDRSQASEDAFEAVESNVESLCGGSYYLLMGKQIDPFTGETEFKVSLKLPRTGAFAAMNSTLEESIQRQVQAAIESQYELGGETFVVTVSSEMAGVNKLKELLVLFLNGTLTSEMSENLLLLNGFLEVDGAIPSSVTTGGGASTDDENVKDYAGITYNGVNIYQSIVSSAAQLIYNTVQIGVVVTSNDNYATGINNLFEEANVSFNQSMNQKIVVWFHCYESNSVKKLYYKVRLKNFSDADANEVLRKAYETYIVPINPTPAKSVAEKSSCPPQWSEVLETLRTYPHLTTCLQNVDLTSLLIYFPFDLNMRHPDQVKYYGGILCGMIDGVLDVFQYFFEISRGLYRAKGHIPLLTPQWWAGAFFKVVEEGGFRKGFKSKFESDIKYWEVVWGAIENIWDKLSDINISSFFHAMLDVLSKWFRETISFVKGTVVAGYNVGKVIADIIINILTEGYGLYHKIGQKIASFRVLELSKIFSRNSPFDMVPDAVKFLDEYNGQNLLKSACKIGVLGCFAAGTPITTANGQVPIEQMLSVGRQSLAATTLFQKPIKNLESEFVLSHRFSGILDAEIAPAEWTEIDYEDITPETWKWVHLIAIQQNGDTLYANLRRPHWWLEKEGVTSIGDAFWLSLPEMGIYERARVVDFSPSFVDTRINIFSHDNICNFRPITGCFSQKVAEIWNFIFSNNDTINVTSNHPFYSIDRQMFVPAGDLFVGERLMTADSSTLAKFKYVNNAKDIRVYNIEVWREHNFYVGNGQVLAHNSCLKRYLDSFFPKKWTRKKDVVTTWVDYIVESKPGALKERQQLDRLGQFNQERMIILTKTELNQDFPGIDAISDSGRLISLKEVTSDKFETLKTRIREIGELVYLAKNSSLPQIIDIDGMVTASKFTQSQIKSAIDQIRSTTSEMTLVSKIFIEGSDGSSWY